MKEEENRARSLFLLDPDCQELKNPVYSLLDVFDETVADTFKFEADPVDEKEQIPLMFTGRRVLQPGKRRY